MQIGCPFGIHLRVSSDGETLEVKAVNIEHNHEVNQVHSFFNKNSFYKNHEAQISKNLRIFKES